MKIKITLDPKETKQMIAGYLRQTMQIPDGVEIEDVEIRYDGECVVTMETPEPVEITDEEIEAFANR
jgi:spore coat protein CotH